MEVLATVVAAAERADTHLAWPLRPAPFTLLEKEVRRLPAAPLATMVTAMYTALRAAWAVLELEACPALVPNQAGLAPTAEVAAADITAAEGRLVLVAVVVPVTQQ